MQAEDPLHEMFPVLPISDTEIKLAQNIASLVPNGATLHVGVGSYMTALFLQVKYWQRTLNKKATYISFFLPRKQLENHKDLGLHSELMTTGVLPLIHKGVITNSKKNLWQGRLTCSFLIGSRELFDFVDDNPQVTMLDASFCAVEILFQCRCL